MGYLSNFGVPIGARKKMLFLGKVMVGTGVLAAVPALSQAVADQYNIPAQPLSSALKTFADQSDMQLLYVYSDVENAHSNMVSGDMDRRTALAQLLRNTDLDVVYRSDAEAVIRRRQLRAAAPAGQESTGGGGAANTRSSPSTANAGQEIDRLEEIIVTSQKREQRLQDVPIPVTAITAAALSEHNDYRLQDYYTSVPGLQFTPNQLGGTATIAIRGVTSGDFSNPTVGITVDDMPFGSSTVLGGGFLVPDLDPSDLARIEVLRGPQGTLYGASSVGGLIKYVTTDPSTDRLSGRVQAGLSSVHGSSSLGYNFTGAINVPVTDTFALRASGFTRKDAGYIDNIRSDDKDVNRTEVKGVHLSALWHPVDNFSLKLSALAQDNKIFGSPYVTVEPGVGDLQQSFLPGSGEVFRKFYAYSANANLTLGDINLVSVTGYSINKMTDAYDLTATAGELTEFDFPSGTGSRGTISVDKTTTTKFTQELRMTMPLGSHVDWLLGAFYTHERTPWLEDYVAVNDDGSYIGKDATFDFWSTYRDVAAFTDFTFHIIDQFDVQVGARHSRIRQVLGETDSGPFVARFETGDPENNILGPDVLVYPNTTVNETANTYLFTPQYKISRDVMVYARYASGYRPGGVNAQGALTGLSVDFKPDKTENYEVGVKASLFDRLLYVDGSIYHIDWKGVQLQQLSDLGVTIFTNGGKAKSEGVELTVNTAPLGGVTLSSWVSWNRAVLQQDLPEASIIVGHDGDRLPFSSQLSANASVDYEFPVGGFIGSVGTDISFVGKRFGVFAGKADDGTPAFPRQEFPGYTKVDLRSGLKMDDWSVDLFVNNVADRRGVLGGGRGTLNPTAFTVTQPRTVGVTVAKKF